MKKTAVLGASPNRTRYSNIATKMLLEHNHPVVPLGQRKGEIQGQDIITAWPDSIEDLDTVTLYLSAKHQQEYYAYILGLNPNRLIFNPGAENDELMGLATIQGIRCLEACTLVLLRTGQF